MRLLEADIDLLRTDLDSAVRTRTSVIVAAGMRGNAKIDRLEQKMDARFTLLQWMMSFMLAAQIATLWKLFK